MKTFKLSDCTTAFAVPGQTAIIDVIHPETGLSVCYAQTLEEIRLRYPGAVIVNLDDWAAAKAASQDSPLEWCEVGQDKYWEMLEILPPAAMSSGPLI